MKTHDHNALVKVARETWLVRQEEARQKQLAYEKDLEERRVAAIKEWEAVCSNAQSTYAELADAARNASNAMKEAAPYLGTPYLGVRQKQ